MSGERNINVLMQNMSPLLNDGDYVFVTTKSLESINRRDTIGEFQESEGTTVILEKKKADALGLSYDFIAAWITLRIHSSLEAVGLTAAFSTALAKNQISCNVIAGYFHDHIFVAKKDAGKAMTVLNNMSNSN